MLTLVGLMAGAVALGLLILPFWSFIRIARLTRELGQLRDRMASLEARARSQPGATGFEPESSSTSRGTAPLVAAAAPAAPAPSVPAASPGRSDAPAGADLPDADDLEARVGGRWLLYVGIAILLIGVSFFLKYAFDNSWITEGGRVTFGALGGLALVGTGWRMARRLPGFGLALAGTGLATLYLSTYAAFEIYALIGTPTAFLLMAATTVLATWLADRGRTQSLGMVAGAGGYLTPFLVQSVAPSAALLFSYDLLLGAGVLVLMRRHQWLALPLLAYVLTVVTLAHWADAHYTDGQWRLVLAALIAFCALFLEMLRFVRRRPGLAATAVAAALWTAPVAYHAAAVTITLDHPPAIHVYLILFTVAAILITGRHAGGWLRLPALLAAYIPLLIFLDSPRGASWLWPDLVTSVSIASLHLMTLVDRGSRQRHSLGTGDLVVLHATVIGLYGLLAQMLAARHPDWPGGAAAALAILSAGLWFHWERRDPLAALNASGLSFTLVAIALAVRFEGPVVVIGWAVEGAVAAWLGVVSAGAAFRFGGLALVALAAGRLAEAYVDGPTTAAVILNARTAATMVVVVLLYLLARQWRRHPALRTIEGIVPVALHLLASALTMMWLSGAIDAYWNPRRHEPEAQLSEELTRSLTWGVYGSALVVVGMWRSLVSLRWIGMAVIGLTVLKVFFVDLSELGGIYRVIGFLVVGVLLVGVSYLYQRVRAVAGPARAGAPPSSAQDR